MILSVGELSARKNHRVVIEALQHLPEDFWYVIIGRGQLEKELRELDKTGRLVLLGYRTDIVDLLHISDVFVFPSRQEGLPVALMEALSCGIACYASKIRGNVDLLDQDYLFDFTSPYEVEKVLLNIEVDKDSLCRKSSLENSFDISYINKNMTEIYENV